MTPRRRIERRNADQTVDPDFGIQQAVGVQAVHFKRDGLDACPVAVEFIGDHGLEALTLGPAEVHAHQHFGPVLRFGTAGTGVDGDDGVELVVIARKQHLGFQNRDVVFVRF